MTPWSWLDGQAGGILLRTAPWAPGEDWWMVHNPSHKRIRGCQGWMLIQIEAKKMLGTTWYHLEPPVQQVQELFNFLLQWRKNSMCCAENFMQNVPKKMTKMTETCPGTNSWRPSCSTWVSMCSLWLAESSWMMGKHPGEGWDLVGSGGMMWLLQYLDQLLQSSHWWRITETPLNMWYCLNVFGFWKPVNFHMLQLKLLVMPWISFYYG